MSPYHPIFEIPVSAVEKEMRQRRAALKWGESQSPIRGLLLHVLYPEKLDAFKKISAQITDGRLEIPENEEGKFNFAKAEKAYLALCKVAQRSKALKASNQPFSDPGQP